MIRKTLFKLIQQSIVRTRSVRSGKARMKRQSVLLMKLRNLTFILTLGQIIHYPTGSNILLSMERKYYTLPPKPNVNTCSRAKKRKTFKFGRQQFFSLCVFCFVYCMLVSNEILLSIGFFPSLPGLGLDQQHKPLNRHN